MPTIHISNHQLKILGNPALSLLNIFMQQGAPIHTACGGKGNCGCCRIRIIEGARFLSKITDTEKVRLGEEKIQEGWRLSCQTYALKDITIYMPLEEELHGLCANKKAVH